MNALRSAHTHRIRSLLKDQVVQLPPSRAARGGSVLVASMGFLSGGLVVSSILGDGDDIIKAMRSCFYRGGDDSWPGQLRSSLCTLKREVENELQDDNRKVIAGLIATNVAVWGLWRLSFRSPRLEVFMWRHFACSYDGVVRGKRVHTLLTSAFSHITLPHLAINMFMLWEFGTHILAPSNGQDSWLDKALSRSRFVDYLRSSLSNAALPELLPLDQFAQLYGASALASSVTSIISSRVRGAIRTPTIGASGAVMGILTMYCLLFPERRMMLYGIFELSAIEMLQLMTAINIVGAAFQTGLRIDFVGHLGGQACGLLMHETPPSLT